MNTKYFHAVTKWRRSKNGLNGILENGDWMEEPEMVKRKVKEFFDMRFREGENIQVKLDDIRFNNISEEDNVMLTRRFSEEEIKDAIWACEGSKSPGPDDYNFGFLKFSWEIVKDDFVKVIQNFEDAEAWPKGLNASFIALVPKVSNPTTLNEFRPISLVGCINKIVAKLLLRRLKGVLQKVINQRQVVFLEGRGLLDSVLVANETLEEVKRNKSSCPFLKLDYEKAYDFV